MKNLIKTTTAGRTLSGGGTAAFMPGFAPVQTHVVVQQRKRLVTGYPAANAQALIVDFPPDLSAPFDERSP